MVLQRKRSLFLGLGLTVALVLAVSPASASAVSTLTGETLNATGGPPVVGCQLSSGSFSYTVSGAATGPYPGTFTETGSGTLNGNEGGADLSASFTIHSGNFLITGSTNGTGGAGTACMDRLGNARAATVGSYQATIHTPTGNYADQGASTTSVATNASGTSLLENFTSSLSQPVLIGPTSKDQCKNNGWKAFPQFKNQGQCVSFVERQGQN